ncbi:MAG TPA: hypothetical protein VGV15_01915, partial [Terriglobales bacterium]|nr:hypothetical protein [Terriglobales bacterium]
MPGNALGQENIDAEEISGRFLPRSNDYLVKDGGKMLGARHIRSQEPSPYATHGDFCRIFEEDMNRLYMLAFLLTGDHSAAEKCFVRGMEDSVKG